MNDYNLDTDLVTTLGLKEYFYDSLTHAMDHQQQTLNPETVFYITNLLSNFSLADQVFEKTDEGNQIMPLALIYARAVNASSRCERNNSLKYLGDISLFISGLYSDSLNRSIVDIDYYIGMGGNAYSYLAESQSEVNDSLVFKLIYDELSQKFVAIVDILGEVSDQMKHHSEENIMRLYEVWLKTHSKRAESRLRSMGIEPNTTLQVKYH